MSLLPKFIRAQKIRFGWRQHIAFEESDRIFMYHNVVAYPSEKFNLRTLHASDFEKQISYLSKFFFKNEQIRTNEIEITFDDGLVNNYLFAKPILEKYGVPATFFVSTENIDSDKLLWPDHLEWLCSLGRAPIKFEDVDYFPHPVHEIYVDGEGKRLTHEVKKKDISEINSFIYSLQKKVSPSIPESLVKAFRTMSSAEIRDLSENPLFTIGSHSHRHIPLSGKLEADQYLELKTSKDVLESITSKAVTNIAFPDGSYDETTLKIATELGYEKLYGVMRNELFPQVKSRKGLYTDEPWYHQLAH